MVCLLSCLGACCPSTGLGCFTVNLLVSLYYSMVLAWVLWYFLNSFQYPLPWSGCPPDLNRTGKGHGGAGWPTAPVLCPASTLRASLESTVRPSPRLPSLASGDQGEAHGEDRKGSRALQVAESAAAWTGPDLPPSWCQGSWGSARAAAP